MTIDINRAPCKSCPYRKDVPSGVWHADEYERLKDYDQETFAQPFGIFLCHQQNESLCRGWLDCHGSKLLAVRVGCSMHLLDPAAVDQALSEGPIVPVFASGREACEHGMKDIKKPKVKARRVIDFLTRKERQRSK